MNLSLPVLEFSRKKHISNHVVEELKSLTKKPPLKQVQHQHSGRTPKKLLRGLLSKKLKPRFLQWEPGALMMNHSVPESGRPILVLFTLREKCWIRSFSNLLRKSPYSVRIWENTDQKNSVFGQFSYSVKCLLTAPFLIKLLVQSLCHSLKY